MLSGTGAAVRADAPARLLQALSGTRTVGRPVWRGSPDQAPQRAVIAVVGGTALEKALNTSLKERRIVAEVVAGQGHGRRRCSCWPSTAPHALFSDRALLLDAVLRSKSPGDLLVRRPPLPARHRRAGDAPQRRRLPARGRPRAEPPVPDAGSDDASTPSYFGPPSREALEFFQLVALPD